MNDLVEYLRERGFIDLSSVSDYFEQQKKTDEFISKMLTTAGVNRRPTPWDRENLNMWKQWNFSEDMIMQAAALAAGKSSPTAYMNGVLSNWKNNGVFTPDAVEKDNAANNNTQEEYNREYERRRSLAVLRAQKNLEKATLLDGFMDVYGKLNGIEKDLAFAEFANNTETLAALESKKKDLLSSVKNMLKTIGLTLEDLSPKYACEKCNDTGYVGTHRCDCFENKVD